MDKSRLLVTTGRMRRDIEPDLDDITRLDPRFAHGSSKHGLWR